jgi:putative ABC transport system ATP-binding protein
MALLQRLNGDGRTVILITHDEELARMAGRMVRLVDGRVVADERVPSPLDAAELLATNGGHP